ncbi:MAG: hypothetical protein CVV49_12620 [Spirochaetae bacterium HGW-Spirochaetae-5]|nr:MAG: hypothetical protein CVV49_12620 [Spirochaetae bacterium HGW-Spirochaetae-5]
MYIFKNIVKYLILTGLSVLLYFLSRHNYLLFHNIVEMYSIIIAAGIFIVSWNSRSHSENNNLVLLGIAYVFIGIIDFFHVLSYKGMNIFTDYDFYANQLWVGARIIESLSLLVFVMPGFRKVKISYHVVFMFYSAITFIFFLSVFLWKIFPICFVAGVGQTPFKIISEYVICIILLISLIIIIRTRHRYDKALFNQISASIIFTILSEFSFTLYTDNYGVTNVIGHLFKVLSFYLIYKSVIVNTLKRPFDILFRELKETQMILQTAMDQSSAGIAIAKAPGGSLQYVNNAGLMIRGGARDEIVSEIGLDRYVESWRMFSLEGVPMKREEVPLARAIMYGEINSSEFIIRKTEGDDRIVLANAAPIKNEMNEITAGIVVFQDITERKQADEKIRKLLEEKEIILKEVHHRIKNNMNTITSLLSIQAEDQDDPITKNVLLDAAGRVQSMKILYDKLYCSENISEMSLHEYLPYLIQEIVSVFPRGGSVKIITRIEDIILNVRMLSPLGIIINELITNSIKYAFIGRNNGQITVTASRRGDKICITYEDDGPGIPDGIDFENSTGFGMQLVSMLVGQINGTVTIERDSGTRFLIEFDQLM